MGAETEIRASELESGTVFTEIGMDEVHVVKGWTLIDDVMLVTTEEDRIVLLDRDEAVYRFDSVADAQSVEEFEFTATSDYSVGRDFVVKARTEDEAHKLLVSWLKNHDIKDLDDFPPEITPGPYGDLGWMGDNIDGEPV